MAAGLRGGSSGQQPRVRKQKVWGGLSRPHAEAGAQRPQVRNSQEAGIKGTDKPEIAGPRMAARQLPPEPKGPV